MPALGVTMQDAIDGISHPGRRAILRLVLDDELPVSELAERVGISQPAASQHLKILRDAGLVRGRVGRAAAPVPSGHRGPRASAPGTRRLLGPALEALKKAAES